MNKSYFIGAIQILFGVAFSDSDPEIVAWDYVNWFRDALFETTVADMTGCVDSGLV